MALEQSPWITDEQIAMEMLLGASYVTAGNYYVRRNRVVGVVLQRILMSVVKI